MLESLLARLTWPLFVAASAGVAVLAFAFAPESLRAANAVTGLVLIVALVGIERWLPYRADWSLRGDADVPRDLGHTLLYSAIVGVTRLLFLVVLAESIARSGASLGLWPAAAPVWLQILLAIVLGDALEYAYHRLSHRVPWLWRIHAIHHQPTRLHVLKAARHHFLYGIGRGFVVWLPLLLLGAPGEVVLWQFVAESFTGPVAHANVRFAIPAVVHRWLVTPEFHRIHHARDPGPGNTNFGIVLPLWDRLFGTHTDPLTYTVRATGIEDDPIPHRFIAELAAPVARARGTPPA